MEQTRKGALSFKDLDTNILEQLNNGEIASVNLTEWLAVDQKILIETFLIQQNREQYLSPILSEISKLKKQSTNSLNETIGLTLLSLAKENNDNELFQLLTNHVSDTVRCWATYTIGRDTTLSIQQKLSQIQKLAADKHFGVREIAWMAVRLDIIDNLTESISILKNWTLSDNEYIRRFATESTRPRGVWCAHIESLKQNPLLAIDLLEPLKSDSSKYVRDSVGNWLNDASKTCPDFVIDLCNRWEEESPTKETAYIIKKALRTIKK